MMVSPIRVLHGLVKLDKGGIETWLMNMVRMQPEGMRFDFVVEKPHGAYEEEARSYGCTIYHHPVVSRLRKRLNIMGIGRPPHLLDDVLVRRRYDVFHMHGSEFLGDGMKIAAERRVPVRVAHSHGTRWLQRQRNSELKLRYLRVRTLDRYRILKYATDIIACSNDAGRSLMGLRWIATPQCSVLYCGVPLHDFEHARATSSRSSFRKKHGIPEHAIVVGHVGSMPPGLVKNQSFLVEVFHELSKRDDRYYLYMAGDGASRMGIQRMVSERGLNGRVLMPGVFDDVPALMIHGFDVHVLPSLAEGLPVVGLEAVASGCYTVCSDTITTEYTEYFSQRVCSLPLNAPPSVWADHVQQAVQKRIAPEEGIALIEHSPFSLAFSLDALIRLYRSRLERGIVAC